MRAALFFIAEPKDMATATRSQEGLGSSPQIARLVIGSDYRGCLCQEEMSVDGTGT